MQQGQHVHVYVLLLFTIDRLHKFQVESAVAGAIDTVPKPFEW